MLARERDDCFREIADMEPVGIALTRRRVSRIERSERGYATRFWPSNVSK
jgi:hypothetical protein